MPDEPNLSHCFPLFQSFPVFWKHWCKVLQGNIGTKRITGEYWYKTDYRGVLVQNGLQGSIGTKRIKFNILFQLVLKYGLNYCKASKCVGHFIITSEIFETFFFA